MLAYQSPQDVVCHERPLELFPKQSPIQNVTIKVDIYVRGRLTPAINGVSTTLGVVTFFVLRLLHEMSYLNLYVE